MPRSTAFGGAAARGRRGRRSAFCAAVLACCPDAPRPLRPLAHGRPPHRRRAHRALQLAARRGQGGELVLRIEDTDRERSTRGERPPDLRGARVARDRPRRRARLPVRSAPSATARSSSSCSTRARLPLDRRPGRGPRLQGGQRQPRLPRRGRGGGRGPPARARRGCDHRASTSSAARRAFENALQDDLVIARADGSPVYHLAVVVDDARRRHHPRRPRRRPLLQHAQARADPAGDGRADARLRPPAAAARAGRQEALQAPRRGLRAGPARQRLPARGGAQLPRAARLGLRRGDDLLHDRASCRSVLARARLEVAGGLRRAEAALDQRPLRARTDRRRPDRPARGAPRARPGCDDAVAVTQEKISTLDEFWPLARSFFEDPVDDPAAREKFLAPETGAEALTAAREALEAVPAPWTTETRRGGAARRRSRRPA